jgi:hypothetical protein
MTEFESSKFDFSIDEKNKVLNCFAEGIMTVESGTKYTDEFRRLASKCAKKGYSIIVNVVGLKPINNGPEMQQNLARCLGSYLDDEFQFKNVFMVKISSYMMQYQVQKSYEQFPGFKEKVTWVKDKEEAYTML